MGQQEGGFGSYLGSLGRRREGAGPPSRSRTDSAADLVRERLASCAEAASSLGVAERWRAAAIPLLANGATALAVHTAVLSAFQVGALALRISSATPRGPRGGRCARSRTWTRSASHAPTSSA